MRVPAVVTDVGDSARLVGGIGHVVPARNSAALAKRGGSYLTSAKLPVVN